MESCAHPTGEEVHAGGVGAHGGEGRGRQRGEQALHHVVHHVGEEGERQGLTLVHVRAQLGQLQDTFMS